MRPQLRVRLPNIPEQIMTTVTSPPARVKFDFPSLPTGCRSSPAAHELATACLKTSCLVPSPCHLSGPPRSPPLPVFLPCDPQHPKQASTAALSVTHIPSSPLAASFPKGGCLTRPASTEKALGTAECYRGAACVKKCT